LAIACPRLYSFALDSDVSLQAMLEFSSLKQLAQHFAIPISEQALIELQQAFVVLQD
jgi:hypothetical protein